MAKGERRTEIINNGGPFGWVYVLSWVGAAVYFVQQTSGFWGVIWAIIKGFLWPAFVTHKALGLLGM